MLSNGNYVVRSRDWDNGGVIDRGAVTWGNGASGIKGFISASNSLIGSQDNDWIGSNDVIALSNGNYVVTSDSWDNGSITDAGAATWGNGTSGTTGVVSVTNSLVGSQVDDWVGEDVIALENGNYVVNNFDWDNGGIINAGAVTWGNGVSGVKGVVSAANSLVGSQANDQVGEGDLIALKNGNYVVGSRHWDNGPNADAGAATWGNGTSGTIGEVSATNSLVGSQTSDQVGDLDTILQTDGNYIVHSPRWDNGGIVDAGAVTWGFGVGGTSGSISASNSVRGLAAGDGLNLVYEYDAVNRQLVVGRPKDNIVTLFKLPYVFLPVVRK